MFNNYDLLSNNLFVKKLFTFDIKKIFLKEDREGKQKREKDYFPQENTIDSEFIKGVENLPKNDDAKEPLLREDSPKFCSLIINNVKSEIRGRKDILLNLTLELFFEDLDTKQEILMKRDEIKIMVMKVIKERELSDIKISFLESQLPSSINSIFDKDIIKKVKIKTIEIEKVMKK